MIPTRSLALPTLLALPALALSTVAADAHASEGQDNCTGFIDAIPATITSQGTWCLRHHLSTAIASGAAIEVATNNVTIDCNGFKLGDLAAGKYTGATGVSADSRKNVAVRHCIIRGFHTGIELLGGSGYLVEYNLVDRSHGNGIHVDGEGSRVYRNRVLSTGGAYQYARGIWGRADVIENTIAGVQGYANYEYSIGIHLGGSNLLVRGNRISGLVTEGDFGAANGVSVNGFNTVFIDNHIIGPSNVGAYGLWTYAEDGGRNTYCRGNTVAGFENNYTGCVHSDGNLSLP